MDSNYTYMVFVECMTFNHHAYIEDAMNGFCMQETNFPFVCVIVDDASTDGEQEIIKLYFDTHFNLLECGETDDYTMTFGQHKTNKNCYFVGLYLKYNHYSIKKDKVPYYSRWRDDCKYIALCEGDDYWIAKEKLQKQVELIERDTKIVMVFSDYETVSASNEIIIRNRYESLKKLTSRNAIESLLLTNYILTCTVLLKPEVYKTDFYVTTPQKYDYTLFLAAAFLGKVDYINKKLASYRKQENSLTNSVLTKKKVLLDIYEIHKSACLFFLSETKYKLSFSSRCKCKYNMMKFAIHIWRSNSDKTFVRKLLKKDYSLILFLCYAIGRKICECLFFDKKHFIED